MRAYTIVVQPAEEHQGHIATMPDLPGWATSGRTVEECVERAREVIGLFGEDLDPPGPDREPSGRPSAALEETEEEAADALRRAMAALRTVEVQLEEEITRRLDDGHDRRPLRRAHAALLRARRSLIEAQRSAGDRALV